MRNDTKETIRVVKKSSHALLSKSKRIDAFMNHSSNRAIGGDVTENGLSGGLGKSIEKKGIVSDPVNSDVVEIYLAQAQSYWDDKQWEKAVKACRNALQISPHSAEAYKLLGNFYQQKSKSADAMGCYAKALSLQPDFPEVYSNLGSLYAKQKKWKQAIAYYQKAISKDARFSPAYLNLSKVWASLNNTVEERKCLLVALKLDPAVGTAQEHYRVACSFEEEGNKEEAIAFYRQCIQRSARPTKIVLTSYQRLADLLEEKGDWQAATRCYHKVLEITNAGHRKGLPTNKNLPKKTSTTKARLQPVRSSAQSNQQVPILSNLSKAEQVIIHKLMKASSQKKLLRSTVPAKQLLKSSKAKSKFDDDNNIYLLNAQKATKAQDWPSAVKYFQKAIKQSPHSATLYRNLAKALAYNHQEKQSAEVWLRAFLLEPNWPSVDQYYELGKKLEEQKKLKEAIYCYQQAISSQPNHEASRHQLNRLVANQNNLENVQEKQNLAKANIAHQQGETFRKKGEWSAAAVAYQQAIQLNPAFSWSYHNLGICYRKLEKWEQAVLAYQRAIQLNPDFVWSYHNLGETLEKLERWEASADAYRGAVKLQPENAQSSERLIYALQQCLKTQPRNIALYAELAEQFILQERVSDCISTYQMAMQIQPQNSALAEKLSILLKPIDPVKARLLSAQAESIKKHSVQVPEELRNLDLAYQVLSKTSLFDAKYYRSQLESFSGEYEELLWHYLKEGSAKGIRPNPLFDTHYYLSAYTEVTELNVNPLAHYHLFGYKQGYNPHPLFSTQYYQSQNSDVVAANVNPLNHYLTNGAQLGREAFAPQILIEYLSELTTLPELLFDGSSLVKTSIDGSAQKKTIGIYSSSKGNFFIAQIAHLLETALRKVGHRVVAFTEDDSLDGMLDEHWVIAPHEFFYMGNGPAWLRHHKWIEKLTVINVEQPQTSWFSKAFHFIRRAKAIFDISPQTAQMLREMQLPAKWLPLGYLEQYEPLAAGLLLPSSSVTRGVKASIRKYLPPFNSPIIDREIDICFIGTLSQRRETFFSKNTHWLSQYQCFLHIPSTDIFTQEKSQTLDTYSSVGISRRSKILLNIHRDETPYFEWHRIVFYGLWQQTLVLTEPCLDIPGLIPNEHFIVADLREMGELIDWLLRTLEGREKAEQVRKAGYQKLISDFSLSHLFGLKRGDALLDNQFLIQH